MKFASFIGAVLIVLSIAGLVYKGFSYQSKETVVKIGSFEATADIEKEVAIPPLYCLIALAAGVGLVWIGRK